MAHFTGGTPSKYDVLYVLDGDFFFGVATDLTRLMHRLFGELPPILVVGIGYGTVDGGVINDRRNRDFTPTADARAPLSGGASRFLDFLRDELKPLNRETVSAGDRTIDAVWFIHGRIVRERRGARTSGVL